MPHRARALLLALGAAALLPVPIDAQGVDRVRASVLREVVPEADRFDEASGSPPVRRAYKGDELVGYVFLNTDLPPPVLGYSGPIETVIGMTPDGVLTGIRVTDYHETYMRTRGDFLRRPGFQEQFAGKSVGDAYRVREDVDGISRVTISVRALARGVRQSARQVAAEYMRVPERRAEPVTDLTGLSWFEMRAMGVAERFEAMDEEREEPLGISILHLESDQLAQYLIGGLYAYATEWAEERGGVQELMLYVVDGSRPRLETERGWSVVQGGRTVEIATDAVAMLGAPWEGILQGETSLVGVIMLGDQVDLGQPMTLVFDQGELGRHQVDYTSQRALGVMAQAAAEAAAEEAVRVAAAGPASAPVDDADAPLETVTEATAESPASAAADAAAPSPEPGPTSAQLDLMELVEEPEESFLARTLAETSWGRVGWITLVLALATLAFFTKRASLRWVSLAATLVVLGYVDGGFLSVSHITSAIYVGPSAFLNDLPLLVMVVFTLLTVLFWGRVFCGYLCPFGALQDLIDAVVPKRLQRSLPKGVHRVALKAKYGVLALIVLPALAGSEISLYQYFEPFGTVFTISPSLLLWTIAAAILLASAVVPRFYCRYACPLGAALALGSVVSLNRIRRVEQCDYCKVCEQKCPTGAIEGPSIDFKECVRCNVCEIELLERTGVCRHDMEQIRPRLVQLEVPTAGLAHIVVPQRSR